MYGQINPQLQQRMAMMQGFKPVSQQQVSLVAYINRRIPAAASVKLFIFTECVIVYSIVYCVVLL